MMCRSSARIGSLCLVVLLGAALLGCSDSSSEDSSSDGSSSEGADAPAPADEAASSAGGEAAPSSPEAQDVLPLTGSAGEAFVAFMDETTGVETLDVYDATREVVRFDSERSAMVSLDGAIAISGWAAVGPDLSWAQSGIEFRVRFGTEQGERRAFFTETATGTICDLRLLGQDELRIFGTLETPPNP